MRHARHSYLLLSATAILLGASLTAAPAVELKIAHFVPPHHSVSIWLENWAKKLEKESNGELKFTIFPGCAAWAPAEIL